MLSALGRGGSSVSRTTTFRNRPILEKYRELHTADGLSIVSFQCKSQQGLKLLLYKEPLLLFSRSAMGPSVWNGKFSFFSFVFFGFLSSSVGSPLDSGQGWRWQSEHMASKPSPTHRWRWCWAKRCRKFIRRKSVLEDYYLVANCLRHLPGFCFEMTSGCFARYFWRDAKLFSSRSTWISRCFERCARISSSPLPLHISDILVLIYMKLSTFSTASPFIQRYPLSTSFAMLPILWIALYSTPVRSQSPLYSFFLYSKQ